MVAQNTLCTYEEKKLDFQNSTALELNECLKQIKLPISRYKCAHRPQLASNICDMGLYTGFSLHMIP